MDDPLFIRHRRPIVEFAAKQRVPAIYPFREHVEAGGLMAYGVNLPDLARRVATSVDRILKGAKPADMPVELPTTFELIINSEDGQAPRADNPTVNACSCRSDHRMNEG